MRSFHRHVRRQAEKAALREMRLTELRDVSKRSRTATIGDVQDMIHYAVNEHDRVIRARRLFGVPAFLGRVIRRVIERLTVLARLIMLRVFARGLPSNPDSL